MRILQLNLNHCKVAQDLLYQRVVESNFDVAILCEQHRNQKNETWSSDTTQRAAIWVCGKNVAIEETQKIPTVDFVWVKAGGIYIYSCYASPNATDDDFFGFLRRLVVDARQHSPKIIAGDFNAWAIEWGSNLTNKRGQFLLDAFALLDVVLLNNGTVQTFQRAGTGSIVDLTFASSSLISTNIKWLVSDEYTHSDHQAIIIEIRLKKCPSRRWKSKRLGWKCEKFDSEVFCFMMENVVLTGSFNEKFETLIESVTTACDASMPRKYVSSHRQPAYWWNTEISDLQTICHKSRRSYQRASDEAREPLRENYIEARKNLKNAIKQSKLRCYEELCNDVDNDPWGRPYRTVMGKLKPRRQVPSNPEAMLGIVTSLFPKQRELLPISFDTESDAETISLDELMEACERVKNQKAPGLDQIPNVALKTAIKFRPDIFLDIYNSCLKEGIFPQKWKRQKLVLIPKDGKPPGLASSYRPICLLDTMGKVFERIIYRRLAKSIEDSNGLSERQYGFRQKRSTLDAIKFVIDRASEGIKGRVWKRGTKKYCALVTLDIKNAFNTANWLRIIEALDKRGVQGYIKRMVRSYFSERVLLYDTDDGAREYIIEGGVPQGSVLGPLLWNIMYDDVLRLELPSEAEIVGFADDIAIVVVAKLLEEIKDVCTDSIDIVKCWLKGVGLELEQQKTEIVLISSRKVKEAISLNIGDNPVDSKDSVRYLGIMIDSRLSFREHLKVTGEKAAKVSAMISRIMPNIGGPSQPRRKLLTSVVVSIILYGAPIWADALKVQMYKRHICPRYRQCALSQSMLLYGIVRSSMCGSINATD